MQFIEMTFHLHPSLQRRIEQQFSPAFARQELFALEEIATGPADARNNLTWPAPPTGHFGFHSESLVHFLWTRLLRAIESPVETLQLTKGWRALQVTGCAIFVQAPDSQIQVMLWQRDDRAECSLLKVQPQVVMLTETPYRMLWLARLEDLAVVSICRFYERQGLALSIDAAKKYARWVFQYFARRLDQHADLRRMRQRCAQALNLKAELFQAAHRLSLISKAKRKASIADYHSAVQHVTAVLKLQQDSPAMLRLYVALSNQPGFPAQGEPLARIRQHLRVMKFSGSVWRLAVKKGARLLLPMREFYSSGARESVNDYLCILEQLHVEADDTPTALRLLFSEFGHDNARRTTYWPKLQPHQAAFAHLLRVIRALPPAHLPAEGQTAVVVRWIVSKNIKGWNRAQRQRGWPWLLASAQAWQTFELSQQEANPTQWMVPFGTRVWAGLTFTALKNAADLILEGHQMRNCAATYTGFCLAGKVLLVAVALATGKRIATASFKRSAGVWRLVSVKGPANRVLKPGFERLIDQFSKNIPNGIEIKPCLPSMADAKHEGNHPYATNEEFVGVPDTNAPQYIGTATLPGAYLPGAYLPAEGAYGEIGVCDACPSASHAITSAAHADQ